MSEENNGNHETEQESSESQSLALSAPQRRLPNNRPVEPSHLDVVRTYSTVGSNRPVTKGTVEISNTITISGNRPIAVGGLQISESQIMGNRPIASNDIDDAATLMGYLD